MKTLFALLTVFAFLWTPTIHAAAPAVTGKWHFVLDTPGGDRTIDSTFQQDSEKVTGKWDISKTGGGDAVAGSFSDKHLALEFEMESEEAGPGTMKIKGALDDDGTMSGTWEFQTYSGTFKAVRVKAEPAK